MLPLCVDQLSLNWKFLVLPLFAKSPQKLSTHKSKNDQANGTMDEGTSICSDSHRCENYSLCIEYPNNEGLVSGGVDGGCKSLGGLP